MKAVIAAAALAVAAAFVPGDWLELRRDGSLLRMLTCHFTHWSPAQLLWDALAFVALGIACAKRDARATTVTLVAAIVLVPVAVFAFAPEIDAYRGLSGLASAMFALLLMTVILSGAKDPLIGRDDGASAGGPSSSSRLRMTAWAFAILFIAKLTYESITGGAVFASDMGADVVAVPVAHVAGALVGMIGGLRRAKLLLLAPLVLASCISVQPPPISIPETANAHACQSADLAGEWSDTRATQVGPAWIKLVLRDDCTFTMRAQLLFMRVSEDGFYAIEDDEMRFVRPPQDMVWRFRRAGGELRFEETPDKWHTYTLSSCGSSLPCSSR